MQVLSFPPESNVLLYLQNHPLTKNCDQRILKAIASAFGGEKKTTAIALLDTNITLVAQRQLSLEQRQALKSATLIFYRVLKDCAEGSPLPIPKL